MRETYGQTGVYNHVSIEHSTSESVYTTIKDYLKAQSYGTSEYIDWICVGNIGKGFEAHRGKLGSLANAVLRAKQMNVLFIPHSGIDWGLKYEEVGLLEARVDLN